MDQIQLGEVPCEVLEGHPKELLVFTLVTAVLEFHSVIETIRGNANHEVGVNEKIYAM